MKNDTIVCNYNLFDMYQHIYLMKEDGTQEEVAFCDMDALGDTCAELCGIYNVENVHLFGQEQYSTAIVDDFNIAFAKKYLEKNNNVKIEVN